MTESHATEAFYHIYDPTMHVWLTPAGTWTPMLRASDGVVLARGFWSYREAEAVRVELQVGAGHELRVTCALRDRDGLRDE